MRIKCRARFEANRQDQFGFYGAKGEPHRRIANGEEFYYDYDKDRDNILEINGRKMLASWIEVLEMPKGRAARKVETIDAVAEHKGTE